MASRSDYSDRQKLTPSWLDQKIKTVIEDTPSLARGPAKPPATYKFTNCDAYARCQQAAVVQDFLVEKNSVESFNENASPFFAWVLQEVPSAGGFLVRIDTKEAEKTGLASHRQAREWRRPKVGDWVYFEFSVSWKEDNSMGREKFRLEVERSADLVVVPGGWHNTLEFRVPVPPTNQYEPLRKYLRSIAISKGEPLTQRPDLKRGIKIGLELKTSWTTVTAELASIDKLMQLTQDSKSITDPRVQAFKYLANFDVPSGYTDLGMTFPAIKDLAQVSDPNVREKLKLIFSQVETDIYQIKAYDSLSRIPAGLFLAPGCFGSGKSFFCMYIAARAQAGPQPAKVLYVLDINTGVEHATKQMRQMYQKLGMKKLAIRVRHFPREMTDSDFGRCGWSSSMEEDKALTEEEIHTRKKAAAERKALLEKKALAKKKILAGQKARAEKDPWYQQSPDWRRTFIEEWRRSFKDDPSSLMQQTAEDSKLCSLDEAAFAHYRLSTCNWPGITSALDSLAKNPDARNDEDWDYIDELEAELKKLYTQILLTADFLAMTPCAAFTYQHMVFPKNDGPDIIVIDEAAHIRESSALILLAAYKPAVWMMVGDHRQTCPFSNDSEFKAQVELSLLERVPEDSPAISQLLTNHRSYESLQTLPSILFYKRQVSAARSTFPESAYHLRRKLSNIAFGETLSVRLRVPRLLVKGATLERKKYDNEVHRGWIMKKAREFLEDKEFTHVHSNNPGTILIVTPYKVAYNKYKVDIQRLPEEFHSRIKVGTIALAQGEEADLVFFDMVVGRATPFNADPKRLCSALTRARQAEIIVIAESMIEHSINYKFDTKILNMLWRLCDTPEHGAMIDLSDH